MLPIKKTFCYIFWTSTNFHRKNLHYFFLKLFNLNWQGPKLQHIIFRLDEDIRSDQCKAERSKTTGFLLLTLPKVKPSNLILPNRKPANDKKSTKTVTENTRDGKDKFLEVTGGDRGVDFGNICQHNDEDLLDSDEPPELEPL